MYVYKQIYKPDSIVQVSLHLWSMDRCISFYTMCPQWFGSWVHAQRTSSWPETGIMWLHFNAGVDLEGVMDSTDDSGGGK